MKKVSLSSLAVVTAGQSAPKSEDFSNSGIPFVRAGSLDGLLSGARETSLELIAPDIAKKRRLKIYPKGSILFAKSGMSATKDRIYVLQDNAYVVSHLAVLVPNENVSCAYMKHALKQFPPSSLIKDPAYPAISLGEIENFLIPIPEKYDDQKRIAHLLDTVDGLISERKRHLQQLDALLQSVFMQMFGDPVRNEKGWKKSKFNTIIFDLRNGRSPSKAGAKRYLVYTLSAITGDHFKKIFKEDFFASNCEDFFPSENDFLICRGNGNIKLVGKGYFHKQAEENIVFPDTIIAAKIKPNSINHSFLEALWRTSFLRNQIQAGARTTNGTFKINQGVIEELKIISPPLALQNQFAATVEKVEGIKQHYHHSLSQLENLYGVLSQKAFKGELDLSRVPEVREIALEAHWTMEATCDFGQLIADLTGLDNAEKRKIIVSDWLESWVKNSPDKPLNIQNFMDNALPSIEAFIDGDEQKSYLRTAFYDDAKDWVFASLTNGTLKQTFDDVKDNAVYLHTGE